MSVTVALSLNVVGLQFSVFELTVGTGQTDGQTHVMRPPIGPGRIKAVHNMFCCVKSV